MAEPQDGATIAALVGAWTWRGLDLDWTRVDGHWLVAEMASEVVGCIAALPLMPVGHCEHLGVSHELADMDRARVVRELLLQAWAVLRLAGCGAVIGTVPDDLETYARALERRGGAVVGHAKVMIKRLV